MNNLNEKNLDLCPWKKYGQKQYTLVDGLWHRIQQLPLSKKDKRELYEELLGLGPECRDEILEKIIHGSRHL